MKYLVQSILIDGNFETVIDSFKTDDYNKTIDFVMKRHKSSNSYIYIAIKLETQEVMVRTDKNKFGW